MNTSETIENKRKQLIFRSDHRGTKEMDLLLGTFAKKYVPDMTEAELSEFEEILKENDPNLYNWMTGKEEEPEHLKTPLFERIKNHKFA